MVRSIRFVTGIALITSAIFFTDSGDRSVSAADSPKAEKKEDKKIEMPKLPDGANPKWDYEAVEEKFTIVKGSINEDGQIYYLLELKEDMATTPQYKVILIDSEGVKFYDTIAVCTPATGKKGDRVRLVFSGAAPANNKDKWIKTVKVQIEVR